MLKKALLSSKKIMDCYSCLLLFLGIVNLGLNLSLLLLLAKGADESRTLCKIPVQTSNSKIHIFLSSLSKLFGYGYDSKTNKYLIRKRVTIKTE